MNHAAFRSSHRVYAKRPPASNRAALYAWDALAPVVSLHLADGYWCGEKPGGDWDEIEATLVRQKTKVNR